MCYALIQRSRRTWYQNAKWKSNFLLSDLKYAERYMVLNNSHESLELLSLPPVFSACRFLEQKDVRSDGAKRFLCILIKVGSCYLSKQALLNVYEWLDGEEFLWKLQGLVSLDKWLIQEAVFHCSLPKNIVQPALLRQIRSPWKCTSSLRLQDQTLRFLAKVLE